MSKPYIYKSINEFKNIHNNQIGIIIGGGPSLKQLLKDNFPFNSLLNKYIIIGTNMSYKFTPCKYMIFSDKFIWDQNYKDIKLFKDIICFTQIESEFKNISVPLNKEIIKIPSKGIFFPMLEKGIKCNNIGSSALSLSHFLGLKKIFLFGIDMQLDEKGNKNFHNEYIDKKPKKCLKLMNQIIKGHYVNMSKIIIELKEKHKIEIISCSETSKLNNLIPYINSWELIENRIINDKKGVN
jgi:hypothetical protein